MSEAIFRTLLRLYPPDFRQRYGAELMECLRQDRSALGRHPGPGLLFRFWARTLVDALASVVKVRTRRFAPQPSGGGSGNGDDPTRRPRGRRPFVEETVQDARYAVRALSKQPGFALVVAGVLGLGIGASTTLFSAVNGVLLRPLPYPEQERLVFLGSKYPQGTGISQMSVPELMDVMDAVSSVEGYAASRGRALDLMTGTGPERVALSEVTPDYFRILGAMPAFGPGFSEEDYRGSGGRVIILGDGLWRRRFGGDPDIIGRAVLASDGVSQELNSYTIVGVLPPGFRNPPPLENPFSRLPPSELWAPLPLNAGSYNTPRTNWTVRTVARLREGASLETLGAELQALERSLVEAYPEVHTRRDTYLGLGARPLLHQMVGSRRLDLLVLLGATGLLLLLACANVAGLLVARSLDRGRELGLRIVLGAGRVRLLRQLLTESLVLALLGGGVGVVLASLGTRAFRVLGPADFPRLAEVDWDPRVLAFGLGLAVLTGLVFGVGPAWTGSRDRGGRALVSAARSSTTGRGTLRVRGGLVAVEVALALILLTGGALLSRSVIRLQGVASGIEADGLALVQVRLLPSYDENEERQAFFSELSHRLAALPGVTSVSHIADPPMGFNQWSPSVWREEDVLRGQEAGSGNAHRVGRDYFRTMGIPLRRGRVFTGDDREGSPRVAVVSHSMAEALWPEEDPLGKALGLSVDHEGPWVTVVGVVGDIRQGSLRSRPGRDIYLPFAQDPGDQSAYMVVRTTGAPLALTEAFRQAVWALDGNVPVPEVTTMKARVDATLRLPRFRALLLVCFAGAALILAAAGIYGTLAYTVGRRTSEVGIRMALGARAGDVVATLVRQGMTPVVVGVVLGLGGALGLTRVLESVLFETSPTDPWTLGLVAGVLVGVSLCASFLPARRASRIHPREALRAD